MVCTLKEFNDYRQYLTTLKLEAEKMFIQEEVEQSRVFVDAAQRHGAEGWGFTCGTLGRRSVQER